VTCQIGTNDAIGVFRAIWRECSRRGDPRRCCGSSAHLFTHVTRYAATATEQAMANAKRLAVDFADPPPDRSHS
jgi:hypothetical protein